VFFALGDRRTLLIVGAFGVALTAGVGWVLVGAMAVRGLTAALSVATSLQLVAYVAVLRLRLGAHLGLARLARPLAEIGVCLVPVALVLAPASRLGDWSEGAVMTNLVVFAGAMGAAMVAYLGTAHWIGLGEVRRVTSRLGARLRRR
jgi:peptidoglycan biosynthesis protein MviN/MurJ (putative lipid II flippase)